MAKLNKYGVTIERADSAGYAYRVQSVEKLTGAENHGAHNIFVQLFDADGHRIRRENIRIHASNGQDQIYGKLDKNNGPLERGHGDIPIWAHSAFSVALTDERGRASDRVLNLRCDYPDEDPGNTWGHHSWRVVFVWGLPAGLPPDEKPDDPLTDDEQVALRKWLAEATDLIPQLEAWLAKGKDLVG